RLRRACVRRCVLDLSVLGGRLVLRRGLRLLGGGLGLHGFSGDLGGLLVGLGVLCRLVLGRRLVFRLRRSVSAFFFIGLAATASALLGLLGLVLIGRWLR